MPRQLDDAAGQLLASHLARLGIELLLGEGARRIVGGCRVEGVQMTGGAIVECDTIVIATGIRPNIELARRAAVSVGRGIRVDDEMRTSDPSIFAVGECAEHRDVVYGLVAPGYEQAAVVATVLAGRHARYAGSMAATRLKVVDLPVFSVGRVSDDDLTSSTVRYVFRRGSSYCKLALEKRRLVGAVAIGDVPQLGLVQEAVTHSRFMWPWQLWRFRRTGTLWIERTAADVRSWPSHVTVCSCTGVTRGALGDALARGARTVCQLSAVTGASAVCGSCRPLLAQLCGAREPVAPVRGWRPLLVFTLIAALLGLALLVPASLNYSASVQANVSFDFLWRSDFWKQVSGYSVLGLSALALVMSVRKRVKRIAFGDFAHWRVVHVAVGTLSLVALVAHTGGRAGANLNSYLTACFVALVLCGSGSAAVVSVQHRLRGDSTRLRSRLTWAHILLFWPVPVLLGFHILKTYYF